jgi:hypothetical protein
MPTLILKCSSYSRPPHQPTCSFHNRPHLHLRKPSGPSAGLLLGSWVCQHRHWRARDLIRRRRWFWSLQNSGLQSFQNTISQKLSKPAKPQPKHGIALSTGVALNTRSHEVSPSAYVSIRQRTSAYVLTRVASNTRSHEVSPSAYVSIRQRTSAYVSIRSNACCFEHEIAWGQSVSVR